MISHDNKTYYEGESGVIEKAVKDNIIEILDENGETILVNDMIYDKDIETVTQAEIKLMNKGQNVEEEEKVDDLLKEKNE